MYEAQAEETPAARLERARRSVQSALSAASTGRPDIVTLCDVESSLNAALREMERLQLTLAVMERQHERMVS
jgi:hypothetical protein